MIVSLWSFGICFFIPLFVSFFFFLLFLEQRIESIRDNVLLIKCLFRTEGLLCSQKLVKKNSEPLNVLISNET